MGDEVRVVDGKRLDPKMTGRGWCEKCETQTARQVNGRWLHGWCERGLSWVVYVRSILKGGGT